VCNHQNNVDRCESNNENTADKWQSSEKIMIHGIMLLALDRRRRPIKELSLKYTFSVTMYSYLGNEIQQQTINTINCMA
jgi:hypothetical protein